VFDEDTWHILKEGRRGSWRIGLNKINVAFGGLAQPYPTPMT
jgi:hypothetical protein